MATPGDSLTDKLAIKTPLFTISGYVVIGVILVLVLVLILFVSVTVCVLSRKRRSRRAKRRSSLIPVASDPIAQFKDADRKIEQIQIQNAAELKTLLDEKPRSADRNRSQDSELSFASTSGSGAAPPEPRDLGWGRWYSLRELEEATGGFAEVNVIGEGGYGVVYRGVLPDGSLVAVKNLLNNKGQAEKEFKVEVEAIGKVRHKNLVGLLGYCADGNKRMLVYEYVDNGNLEQWLHGDVGPSSPLTWEIRMKIAIGTAKGLAYLHEGLEPKVVHRDVKSSNILLDRKWNAKVSDFGLAKLLQSEKSHVTTRVMGTFGYVSPEYASTGMLTEASDVYSFGVLLMEIITGRIPVDYSKPPEEMNLIDWFKSKVAARLGEEVVDPLIMIQPTPRQLKRVLLVCLRCIDPDVAKRPKMGQTVHMLEAEEFPFRAATQAGQVQR
uniref:non-specific serine/threonine protein kinase n=1 Tax=Kalanchoe fedtschenkoi TaxID=63787 RepID=A0A7N0T0P8_KALFE